MSRLMGVLDPTPPPYDPLTWERLPLAEKARQVCQAWALQGYGTPITAYVLYAAKVALYVGGWLLSCSFASELGDLSEISSWWLYREAFQRAILWSMLFEVLGLGCGSGPLTGRYLPPFGGFLYFLYPGTTKAALFPNAPIIGGTTRGWLEAGLYAGLLGSFGFILSAPSVSTPALLSVVLLVPALGLLDKTVFLAARSEHYWITAVVMLIAIDFVPGAKIAQAALWIWAGVSKLNRHFPAVICVMNSNSPFTPFRGFRRRLYRDYPHDLRPSWIARWMAHSGAALELAVPVTLLLGDGGALTTTGLVLMLLLHVFITSTVPMGVPIEWNVMVVYGAFFLFGEHAAVSIWSMEPLWLYLPVLVFAAVLPLIGNVRPDLVSFLLSMRYYAGNWAYSVWFFRDQAHEKLARLKKTSGWIYDQLAWVYDRRTRVGLVGKVIGFRLMHLHGRAMGDLVGLTLDDPLRYQWIDGELIAGMALGWNFGDGHLHNENLLAAIQSQCQFEEGELRCVFVESQPLMRPRLAYRICDAASGEIARDIIQIDDLIDRQPWDFRWPNHTMSSL